MRFYDLKTIKMKPKVDGCSVRTVKCKHEEPQWVWDSSLLWPKMLLKFFWAFVVPLNSHCIVTQRNSVCIAWVCLLKDLHATWKPRGCYPLDQSLWQWFPYHTPRQARHQRAKTNFPGISLCSCNFVHGYARLITIHGSKVDLCQHILR